jgi:hypothetical protein
MVTPSSLEAREPRSARRERKRERPRGDRRQPRQGASDAPGRDEIEPDAGRCRGRRRNRQGRPFVTDAERLDVDTADNVADLPS